MRSHIFDSGLFLHHWGRRRGMENLSAHTIRLASSALAIHKSASRSHIVRSSPTSYSSSNAYTASAQDNRARAHRGSHRYSI